MTFKHLVNSVSQQYNYLNGVRLLTCTLLLRNFHYRPSTNYRRL